MGTGLLLFGSMALFLIIGVPIAFALGAAVWTTIVFSPDFLVTTGIIGQRIFGGLESTSIMAIPFFILAGNLMTKGGISKRLVDFANSIVGGVRGGMALALVLACAFFAALSGSAPATVIAIGSMLYPEMTKMGYPKDRTAGLLVVSGGLGPIIPPSIIMVVYATITGASISEMFTSGMFIYKEVSVKDLVPIFLDSAKGSAMILFIIATSTAFSWIFAYSGISGHLVHFIVGMNLNKTLFCLVVAIILLIFGTFLEGIATCVLMVPILWPIAAGLGIDAVHFGMIVSISNVVGTMTPPVAVNIFSAASVSKLKMGEIVKGQIPFFIGYIAVFLLVVLVPGFSHIFG